MARPRTNNAQYYPHDTDMRNDAKIKVIRKTHGATGYAVWAMLLEVLTDSDNYRIKVDELTIDLLAADFDLPAETLAEILASFRRLKLIQYTEKEIFAPGLFPRMEPLEAKRARKRAWAERNKQRNDANETPETPVNDVLDVQNPLDKDKDKDKLKNSNKKQNSQAAPKRGQEKPQFSPPPPGGPAYNPPDIDTEIAEMKKDDLCRENFYWQSRAPIEDFDTYADAFALKLKSEERQPASRTDLRSYFFNWSRDRYEREQKRQTDAKGKNTWSPDTIREGLEFARELSRDREGGLI